jgi:hypothetical protein
VKMMNYGIETWIGFSHSARELWKAHHAESSLEADLEFAIDEEMYGALDKIGRLLIMTARAEGVLVGYITIIISKHPHYNAMCGFQDALFVSRPYRFGKGLAIKEQVGVKLIEKALTHLRRLNVGRAYFRSPVSCDYSSILKRLGFAQIDSGYAITLGEKDA